MADYRRLMVWRKAHQLVLAVYSASASFPKSELYGLASQVRRAAASVPANLAEGYGKGSDAELARYCRISVGSANELEYHLLLARDLNMLDHTVHKRLELDLQEVRRMLTGLARKLAHDA